MPSVTIYRVIEASQQEVWDVVSDIENASRWNRAWQRIEVNSYQKKGVGVTFRVHSEDGVVSDLELSAWVPTESIAFAPKRKVPEEGYSIRLKSQAFHLYPISESQTKLELTATASTSGLRGWLVGQLFWPGYQTPGLRQALDNIADLF